MQIILSIVGIVVAILLMYAWTCQLTRADVAENGVFKVFARLGIWLNMMSISAFIIHLGFLLSREVL